MNIITALLIGIVIGGFIGVATMCLVRINPPEDDFHDEHEQHHS